MTTTRSSSADVCSVKLLIDGEEVSQQYNVLSLSISNEFNRIPSACIQIRDGEAASRTFAASDTEIFVPGRDIEIRLGYRGDTVTVFAGLVTANRVRVRKHATLLWVECRDRSVRMTRGRKCRYFVDTTDGELLDEVLAEHGLERSVDSTTPQLGEVIQYDCTDWDFVVCRAEANGHLVTVRDGAVRIGPPVADGDASLTAVFGDTVLELDAEIDARLQPTGIVATAWNAAEQKLATADAAEPPVTDGGNLTASELAEVLGGDPHRLRHGGGLTDPELQAWADARLAMDRLGKVRGRVRVQGSAATGVGDIVEVTGIGGRFAGKHIVSGVRHSVADGNWETDVAFGLSADVHAVTYPVQAAAAGGLAPAVSGLHVGVVTALADDPDGEHRIKVRLPVVSDADDGAWARLATLDAGDGRGTFFRPEIDDEVLVGFLHDDPRFPVVLGQLHSSARPAPEAATDDNHIKGYVSRSKISFTFDDDTKTVVIETPAGNKLTLDEDAKKVTLLDQNGGSVELSEDGLTLTSSKDIILKASGDVTIEGTNLELRAQSKFKAAGQSGVDITSSGTLTVKGSLVQIN